jgi:hypothetical protein
VLFIEAFLRLPVVDALTPVALLSFSHEALRFERMVLTSFVSIPLVKTVGLPLRARSASVLVSRDT